MTLNGTLENEVNFHDSIAKKIIVDNAVAKKMFAFDSPASYNADRHPRLKKNLLKALGNPRGRRVLVYGCGNDSAAVWFSKSGANVDAIDISPKSIENQKLIADLLNLDINHIVMDAHNLDLPSDEYDIVYGNAILHHLELQKAIPEVVRVLKQDGKAVFRDVMRGNIFLQSFRFATPFWRTPDEHPLTNRDFTLLEQNFTTFEISRYILSGLPYFFFARIANNIILKKSGFKWQIPLNNSIYAAFDKFDEVLFRLMPSLKNQAWLCLIIMTKK